MSDVPPEQEEGSDTESSDDEQQYHSESEEETPQAHEALNNLHAALAPQALLQIFEQFQSSRRRAAASHAELVQRLHEARVLTSPAVKA
eukprot:CAMPEP_0119085594 /NCGR_PEP_ID=MMETSP1178-20130426/134471_1 /TAXON_ID=33656 /ORGANISM="unid sp, Strain CCMP2000" /LENGTH=88 /DNA_ID=CAMNT_0007068663 /DNA_START=37 /DNA_END=299 /DNA_ORIENTATION=+